MHTVTFQRTLAHSPERVWALVDDFSGTWAYHPLVSESPSTNGVERGMGAQRRCQMYTGDAVEERVTAHDASARRYSVEVVDHGPFPVTHMEVDIQVDAAATAGHSVLTYTMSYVPKFGPMGWLMAKVAMNSGMRKMLGQLFDGIESHLETGRVVGKDGVLDEATYEAAA